jgi:hypothetical protein
MIGMKKVLSQKESAQRVMSKSMKRYGRTTSNFSAVRE